MALLVYMEATKPQPVNWFPSYVNTDKIPLGTKVFFDLFEEKLGTQLQIIKESPYVVLEDSTFTGTYFFLNDEVNFDEAEFNKLQEWITKGNTLFVSANYLSYILKDTLKIETQTAWLRDKIETEPMLNLINSALILKEPIHIKRNLNISYFETLDTLKQRVLGVAQPNNDTLKITKPKVNFIEQKLGDGKIILHLQPEVFSNYALLNNDENLAYTQGVLSYIDTSRPVYWDSHYKSGTPLSVSPLKFLLANKHFKWAYYILLIGVLLFVLFEGKRKQRSIPIFEKQKNRTYEYTQTIAGMYLDKKEYSPIVKKQIALFMEYVRTQLRIPTQTTDNEFAKKLAARSGNTLEDTNELLTFMNSLTNLTFHSESHLKELYTKISDFKKYTDGKS